ncbi:MAG: DUF805 domain-containing protein [Bauldia sp.]|jgi:uncharacterized membrane protein YhaH (DUF805 family)
MPVGHLFFGFTGRINRGKIWLALLVYVLTMIAVAIVVSVVSATSYLNVFYYGDADFQSIGLTALVVIAVYIVLFVSQLAVSVKRLHDRGKSGWWVLVFAVLPALLGGVGLSQYDFYYGYYATGGGSATLLTLASAVFYIWGFVELYCLRGTIGDNRFGSDPIPMIYYGGPNVAMQPSYPGQQHRYHPAGQPQPPLGASPPYPPAGPSQGGSVPPVRPPSGG